MRYFIKKFPKNLLSLCQEHGVFSQIFLPSATRNFSLLKSPVVRPRGIEHDFKIIGLFIFIAVIVIFYFNNDAVNITNEIKKVCFQNNCFNVEIADNNEERVRGLMFIESLCKDCGMLFVFEKEGNYKFWMKNTLIPLDIIWIDKNLEVVYIANAVPCAEEKCELYGLDKNSLYVLEINEGESDKIGLKVGSKTKFKS